MNYSLTIFKNTFDNKTHRVQNFDTWADFESLLYSLYNKKGIKGGKESSPLISPSLYEEGTTRSNRNVHSWGGFCMLDVDDFHLPSTDNNIEPVTRLKEELFKMFGAYQYICYNTASSRPEQPKFRLVFPVTRKVELKDLPHFWFAMNKQFGELGDEQTKDVSRMYYVPAQYPDALSFIFSNEGVHVDPDMLMNKHSYVETQGKTFLERLPPALQKAVIEHRKNSLSNTDVSWTSYRDCPFFPKRMVLEYRAITGTGWYYKMYQIMIAVAGSAVKRGYPISAKQIADMCQELDNETGQWYGSRPLEREADRALEYIYRNG